MEFNAIYVIVAREFKKFIRKEAAFFQQLHGHFCGYSSLVQGYPDSCHVIQVYHIASLSSPGYSE